MTEQEYIDTCNLARIRAARALMRDCADSTVETYATDRLIQITLAQLWELERALSKRIKTTVPQ